MTSLNKHHPEFQYLSILSELELDLYEALKSSKIVPDRTGVGTVSRLGREMRFDIGKHGMPIFTSKKVLFQHSWKEILWMLRGETNIRSLLVGSPRVSIWTDWPYKAYLRATKDASTTLRQFEDKIINDEEFAAKWGELGPVYGKQWRKWAGPNGQEFDQVQKCLDLLKNQPHSRRILWSGWNVAELDLMAERGLPPCHIDYQWYVGQDERLNLYIGQRSADIFLGVPFNICGGALLLEIFSKHLGREVGELVWYGRDVHLYSNHLEQASLQLMRKPNTFPELKFLKHREKPWDHDLSDFELINYQPHSAIKAPVAV